MKNHILFLFFLIALAPTFSLRFQPHAAPAGPLIKHLSSIIKWTRSTSKTPQSDGNVLQFENGYVVETVVEGNEIGVIPHRIRVSEEDGELFAVDAINSNIVRITPPLSQYSRGRLVAGSFQGYTGHVDGKPSDARFNHPKGITVDDKGNVYVADTQNLAIRKIGDSGVTTIAGGKSNVAGYRDGPSEDAKFSNDFDVVYVRPTCSLLVIDRGNAALRQISLDQEDCDYQSNSISSTDILTVVGAVIVGYATCMLQQGFGSSFFSKTRPSEKEFKGPASNEKHMPILESSKEEPGWPSFGQLIVDLSKLSLEALAGAFTQFIPSHFRPDISKRGLTPLKDRLVMPEDEAQPPLINRQNVQGHTPLTKNQLPPLLHTPLSDSRMAPHVHTPPIDNRLVPNVHTPSTAEKYSEMKPPKIKSSSFKDPSLSSKHRSSKRPDYAEFYGSTEIPPYSKSKSQKERPRHRQREKSGEFVMGAVGTEAKAVEPRAVDHNNPKFDHYSMRTKYASEETFRFNSK
ncbi:internalin A [Vigna unguiculata]|uniref:Internalin A n=1 Tax=Vigna unguiculata TaxID=3917 RepID=A0A4D6NBH4_VIGUN|nr:internalin A [Vigna unguiculata]